MTALKTEFLKYRDSETGVEQLYEVIPPAPTESDRGGIIAAAKTENETVEAKLGEDGKLYVPEGTKDYNALENVPTKLSQFENDLEIVTSWNDLEDKPFYKIEGETVLVEEQSFEAEFDQDEGLSFVVINTDFILAEGKEYTVLFDGTEYNLTCFDDEGYPTIGSPYGDFSEYSFCIYSEEDNILNIATKSTEPSHTFSLVGDSSKIVTLDEKYIPDTIVDSIIAVKDEVNLKPGLKVEGNVYTVDEEEKTASVGAEIFNNYENNVAIGEYAHAEGNITYAIGDSSHSEGWGCRAYNEGSHAEGIESTAKGYAAHSEGWMTQATGTASHVEGVGGQANGPGSHAEGALVVASGDYSHAEGRGTTASSKYQHVQGKYNVNDVDSDGNALDTYTHIVGNGESDDARSNAHTLDWDGNAWFAGDVYVGSTSGTNKDDGSKKLMTESDVDTKIENITTGGIVVSSASKDGNGNVITDTYETKTDAVAKLTEAKSYTDTVASGKADTNHNHDEVYSSISHNHDGAYSSISHNHDYNDLNNKPFYMVRESTDRLLLDTTSFVLEADSTGNATFEGSNETYNVLLVPGETYTVVYNGIAYDELPCVSISGKNVVGSLNLQFTDYPFLIGSTTDSFMLASNTAGECTVSIYYCAGLDLGEMYIEPKYTPHFQSDWLEESEYKIGYIKNKPFGTKVENIVLVETNELSFITNTSYFPYDNVYASVCMSQYEFVENQEYNVVWDNQEFNNLKPYIHDDLGLVIGGELPNDQHAYCDFSEYPFIIVSVYPDADSNDTQKTIVIATNETEETHVVGVSGNNIEIITKIDEKYIPDTIARVSDLENTYETKTDAAAKLTEAKTYADTAAATVKNDLLNGAGEAYDTLQELGALIDENQDAIEALNTVAAGKANAEHTHDTIYYTMAQIDAMEFITEADIDEICGAIVEEALTTSDIDELMLQIQ